MEIKMDPSERPSGETEPAESGEPARSAEPADRRTDTVGEENAPETRGARFARKARRTRLYVYAGAAVALLVFIIALVTTNTGRVKVSWVFGSSSVSLVWLVLIAAVLGLLLGMVIGALFHWRTRTPRNTGN
jgi:uncharacterized integral membrane protein